VKTSPVFDFVNFSKVAIFTLSHEVNYYMDAIGTSPGDVFAAQVDLNSPYV